MHGGRLIARADPQRDFNWLVIAHWTPNANRTNIGRVFFVELLAFGVV